MIKTSKGVFVAGLGSDYENFEVATGNRKNKLALRDTVNGVLLKNIFHIGDFTRKSYVDVNDDPNKVETLNVFSPELPFKSITQFNNSIVGLTTIGNKGVSLKRYDEVNDIKEVRQNKNTLAVYPPSGLIDASKDNLEPLYIISGIEFNFLEETPVEFEYYDFSTGIMYTNSMNMKNMYDPGWNVSAVIVSANPLSATSGTIGNTRYYVDVNSDNNTLIYNVYHFKNEYDSTSAEITSVVSNPLNSNPYFLDWNPENTVLSSWTSTSGISSYVDVFGNESYENELSANFSLFNAVYLSAGESISADYTLSAGVTYILKVDLYERLLSGTGIESNGKTVSGAGVTSWEYTPTGTETFFVSGRTGSEAVVRSAVATNKWRGVLNFTRKGILNGNFDQWDYIEDSYDDFYFNPTSWNISGQYNVSGITSYDDNIDYGDSINFGTSATGSYYFVRRDKNTVSAKYRKVIDFSGEGYLQLSNPETLSGGDKTYAVLVKMPSEPPAGNKHTICGGDDQRTHDNIAFKENNPNIDYYDDGGDPITRPKPGPSIVWHGGSSVSTTSGLWEPTFSIPEDRFNGRWEWMVFRKDTTSATVPSGPTYNAFKKFDMENISIVSGIFFDFTETYIDRVGYCGVSGELRPSGASELKMSRFYSWNSVLTDSEVSGIIRRNNIPSGYNIFYNFDRKDFPETLTNGATGYSEVSGTLIGIDAKDAYSSRMAVAEPKGTAWMHAGQNEIVDLWQDNVFTTSGLYDVTISTRDHGDGVLGVYCGSDLIGQIESQGDYRWSYTKTTSGPEKLVLRLDAVNGGGDISIDRVSVTPMSLAMAYDYIENIDGFYRYQNVPKHKSNLFSIRIKNSNVNDSYFGTDKNTIQKSINNIITKIIDKIVPIHTQLFNIFWTGE